jgi:hypothetical protein
MRRKKNLTRVEMIARVGPQKGAFMNLVSRGVVLLRQPFRRIFVVAAGLCFLLAPVLFAQEGLPKEILERTMFIKTPNGTATAFKVDYRGKVYLVTTRHIVAGLPATRATIQVREVEEWEDLHTIKILFPKSADVDIAVLETEELMGEPYHISMAREPGGVLLGQQVWYLGFPFAGIRTRAGEFKVPFIKRGAMSAVDTTNPNAIVLYVDGFNNPGFSGGPIVYWDLHIQKYRIVGVVQGYKEDTARINVNGGRVNTQLLVNSGILVGYSIAHAIQAIEQGQSHQ